MHDIHQLTLEVDTTSLGRSAFLGNTELVQRVAAALAPTKGHVASYQIHDSFEDLPEDVRTFIESAEARRAAERFGDAQVAARELLKMRRGLTSEQWGQIKEMISPTEADDDIPF